MHWAASADDVDVLDALLDAGAARRSRDEDADREPSARQTDRLFAETVDWLETL